MSSAILVYYSILINLQRTCSKFILSWSPMEVMQGEISPPLFVFICPRIFPIHWPVPLSSDGKERTFGLNKILKTKCFRFFGVVLGFNPFLRVKPN